MRYNIYTVLAILVFLTFMVMYQANLYVKEQWDGLKDQQITYLLAWKKAHEGCKEAVDSTIKPEPPWPPPPFRNIPVPQPDLPLRTKPSRGIT